MCIQLYRNVLKQSHRYIDTVSTNRSNVIAKLPLLYGSADPEIK